MKAETTIQLLSTSCSSFCLQLLFLLLSLSLIALSSSESTPKWPPSAARRCREVSENSLETESLARFAVDEHNKKEVIPVSVFLWFVFDLINWFMCKDLHWWKEILVVAECFAGVCEGGWRPRSKWWLELCTIWQLRPLTPGRRSCMKPRSGWSLDGLQGSSGIQARWRCWNRNAVVYLFGFGRQARYLFFFSFLFWLCLWWWCLFLDWLSLGFDQVGMLQGGKMCSLMILRFKMRRTMLLRAFRWSRTHYSLMSFRRLFMPRLRLVSFICIYIYFLILCISMSKFTSTVACLHEFCIGKVGVQSGFLLVMTCNGFILWNFLRLYNFNCYGRGPYVQSEIQSPFWPRENFLAQHFIYKSKSIAK